MSSKAKVGAETGVMIFVPVPAFSEKPQSDNLGCFCFSSERSAATLQNPCDFSLPSEIESIYRGFFVVQLVLAARNVVGVQTPVQAQRGASDGEEILTGNGKVEGKRSSDSTRGSLSGLIQTFGYQFE